MSTRSVNAAVRRLQGDLERARPKRRYMSFAAFVMASMDPAERPEGWEQMNLPPDAEPNPRLARQLAASVAPAGTEVTMVRHGEPEVQPSVPSPTAAVVTLEETREVVVRETVRTRMTVAHQIHPRVSPGQVLVLHGNDRLVPGDLCYCADLDEPDRRGVGRAATERDLGPRWR